MPDSSDILWNDIVKDYGKKILEMLLVDQTVTVAKHHRKTHHIS